MKDLKISKELIKAVLKKETETLSKDFNFTINEDYIEFSDDGEMQFEYCIYKFAFKCKEWALSKNYSLMSREAREYDLCSPSVYKQVGLCNVLVSNSPNTSKGVFVDNTEVGAITKACEHILKESK